jgi:hypothetical protein
LEALGDGGGGGKEMVVTDLTFFPTTISLWSTFNTPAKR